MTEQTVNTRYRDYVNNQVDRIYGFKENYEENHAVALGAYPFTVENKYEVPDVSILAESDAHSLLKYKIIEQHIQSQIKSEFMIQGDNPDVRDMYRSLQAEERDNSVQQLTVVLAQHKAIDNEDEAYRALDNLMVVLEDQDHPTLERIKLLDAKGVSLTSSPKAVQLHTIQSDMDQHYESTTRPSEQMEQLIEQAEKEARTLDRTLDSILELEEKGVQNPLNAPDIEPSDQKSASSNERDLIKAFYRNKQVQSTQRDSSPNRSQDMDI